MHLLIDQLILEQLHQNKRWKFKEKGNLMQLFIMAGIGVTAGARRFNSQLIQKKLLQAGNNAEI